jgi:hypothetical protein
MRHRLLAVWLSPRTQAILFALAALFVLALTFGAKVPAAHAATTCSTARQSFPLHAKTTHSKASCGENVAALQWLLHGGKPFALKQAKPTFKGEPNGSYGAITKHAVLAMKFRVGYPAKGQCKAKTSLLTDTTTRYFFFILENKAKRPLCWVGLAAARVKGAIREGQSDAATKIKAFELSQLGVHESPYASNRGPCISYTCSLGGHLFGPYQGSTGAYGLAWCASFGDYAMKRIVGHGFGSSNDAYVPTIALYARDHGWLAAKPKAGSFVVFLSASYTLGSAYHIGFVVKVTASGVQTIEGNAGDAYGGGVHEVWRSFSGNRMVYLDFPGVA